jgi:hypothetical protein
MCEYWLEWAKPLKPETKETTTNMKCHLWTLALLGAGVITLPSVAKADEKSSTPVLTSLATTTISGYVDTSVQWNPGTGNANLPPYAFGGPSKADGFNLNVVKLSIEKPIDVADTWAAGYKVDLLFGPDANALATQSLGVPGDFALKQAYVALHAPVLPNGLDFKVGVWDTLIGYEVFESGNNPNFTRSYGYSMEPTTHTGVQMSYQVCELLTVNFGVANTFGPTINGRAPSESYKTYMGSFTITAPTNSGVLAGSTLTGCIINGFNSLTGNETSYYGGASVNTPVAGLKAGLAFDYMDVHNTRGETWAVGGYLAFQATEKLGFYGRVEYLRDRGDQKLFVKLDPTSSFLVASAPDRVLALTTTVQYDLWKNVMSRLEVRWDHSMSGAGVWGNTDAATGTGTLKNEVLVAANLIYKF